jgi:hypothetical protein
VAITKDTKSEESGKAENKSDTITGFYLKYRIKLPSDTDLFEPNGASVRISREVMATLIQMKQIFPGIEFDFKRETSLPWIPVPLDEEDF